MATTAEDQEIILKVGCDEISLTLYGVRLGNDKWKFRLDKAEDTMANSLSAEDGDLLPKLQSRSKCVDTWDDAIKLLDQFLWTWYPLKEVHYEFSDLVFSALRSRKPFKNLNIEI
jgi:hypothetical protein